MGRPRTGTSTAIVEIAERLLMQRGYHAFSYQHIADELAVRPPAVHYHFRTKEELVVAVVKRYGARFARWEASIGHLSAADRLVAYFDIGRHAVADQRVCALAMINAQFASVPTQVQAVAIAVQERVIAFYVRALNEGRAAGQLAFTGDTTDKATEIACALVGAQQMSRGLGPIAYERVIRHLAESVGVPMPESVSESPWTTSKTVPQPRP